MLLYSDTIQQNDTIRKMKEDKAQERLYFDFSASTPVDQRVEMAMEPYWRRRYANALSNHSEGVSVRKDIQEATLEVARALGAESREIHWTSGGTESNTWALRGVIEFIEQHNGSVEGLHVIVGAIEHVSVGGLLHYATQKGMEVSVVSVTLEGIIDMAEVEKALRPETVLVTVLYASNEIGTVQPISLIGELIRAHREKGDSFSLPNLDFKFPAFHSDASQAFLYLPVEVNTLGLDLLTLDGHKMYGPKGVGVLYIREGLLLTPLFFSMEGKENARYGTPPTPLIIGCAKAIEIAEREREMYTPDVEHLRDYCIRRLEEEFEEIVINGSKTKRLANNISFSFPGQNHEFLAVLLDERGIAVSTKSACKSFGTVSHVVKALKGGNESAIRISLGKETSKKDVDALIGALVSVLKKS